LDYPSGLVTLATTIKDCVRFLQELGFQLVDVSQLTTPPNLSEKEVKVGDLVGLNLTIIIPGISEPLHIVVSEL